MTHDISCLVDIIGPVFAVSVVMCKRLLADARLRVPIVHTRLRVLLADACFKALLV